MVFGQGGDDPTLELTALPEREPALHGGTGLVHMGAEAGSTYYYSRTRLSVAGWLTLDGERRPAQGSAWMDHQWGDLARGKVGWDWASVQLDDGSDLMVAVVWSPEGRRRLSAHGTYIDPDGAVVYLHEGDFSITAQGAWRSPKTGIEYPMGWRVGAPSLELTLELVPYLENAEFDSKVLNVAYWEGAASVSGRRGGQSVAGWGFVELAGYDPRLPEVAPPHANAELTPRINRPGEGMFLTLSGSWNVSWVHTPAVILGGVQVASVAHISGSVPFSAVALGAGDAPRIVV